MSRICPKCKEHIADEDIGELPLTGQYQCPECNEKFISYPQDNQRVFCIGVFLFVILTGFIEGKIHQSTYPFLIWLSNLNFLIRQLILWSPLGLFLFYNRKSKQTTP